MHELVAILQPKKFRGQGRSLVVTEPLYYCAIGVSVRKSGINSNTFPQGMVSPSNRKRGDRKTIADIYSYSRNAWRRILNNKTLFCCHTKSFETNLHFWSASIYLLTHVNLNLRHLSNMI